MDSVLVQAVWMGLLEGVTEFLPVSSTGHLILLDRALEATIQHSETFEIFIQLGAILAVVFLYWQRFLRLFDLSQRNISQGFSGIAGLFKLGIACLPAFVLGALLHQPIKELLFKPLPVALALITGAILMIVVECLPKKNKVDKVEDLTLGQCFGIGVFQCLALWPGMSRSGSTIIGAMFLGVTRPVAAEFSFLVAVPVMCAAVAFDLLKSVPQLTAADLPVFAVGFVVSFLSALAAVKIFVGLVQTITLRPFAYYRIFLGLMVLWLLWR